MTRPYVSEHEAQTKHQALERRVSAIFKDLAVGQTELGFRITIVFLAGISVISHTGASDEHLHGPMPGISDHAPATDDGAADSQRRCG